MRILLFLSTVFSLLLASCSSPRPQGHAIDITFWYQHTQSRARAMEHLIQQFNQTNPWDIHVHGEFSGNYSETFSKMAAGIAGGVLPDLVVAYQTDADVYREAGALVNLSPFVTGPAGFSSQQLADFVPGFLTQDLSRRFSGERLGWPINRSAEVLYYNKDWLHRLGLSGPPSTWEEFAQDCRLATNKSRGTVGYEIRYDASNIFAQVISRGGSFSTPDQRAFNFSNPQVQATFRFLSQLYRDGFAAKVAEKYADQADFANQKVLFVMDSSSGIPFYEKAIKTSPLGHFAWGIASLPHSTPQPVLNIYGASISVIKSTPEHELAAWRFLRWMSEPTQQAAWVEASNYFPVRFSTAAQLTKYLAAHPQFEQAFSLLKTCRLQSEPVLPGYEQVRDAISSALNAVLEGAPIPLATSYLQKQAELFSGSRG
ncbi:MAG: ABC transporter substrate-binding protein [Spirochaetales bacterium]|nr:ABC transporter substrate-binding protein [Spirochaetales bacterium]